MTKEEFDRNVLAPYAPEAMRLGQQWDGSPGSSPATAFWHYRANGREFVVVKCGADDHRVFVPVEIRELRNYLGPTTEPQHRTT